MYNMIRSTKLVYLLVGLIFVIGMIGCSAYDNRYLFQPSSHDRAVIRAIAEDKIKNTHKGEKVKFDYNGMKVVVKDSVIHIKDLKISIPVKDIKITISDEDALGFADDVSLFLRKRMNTARRVRLGSSTVQLLTAAAAGSLGIIAGSDVETISALSAVSAIVPELQSIFRARGRSEAYRDGLDLIRKAIARYHRGRTANNGKGVISHDELTEAGSQLMSEVAASIKAIDKALQQSIPSIEDMKAATGELKEDLSKYGRIKVVPKIVRMPWPVPPGTDTATINIINDRAVNALSKNPSVVVVDDTVRTKFSNNQKLNLIEIKSVGTGTATIEIYNENGDVGTVRVKVGNRKPEAHIGAPPSVKVGEFVDLRGDGSFDPDGDRLSYRWTVDRNAQLSSYTSVSTYFPAEETGTYTAKLTVNDGVDFGTDTATITVKD